MSGQRPATSSPLSHMQTRKTTSWEQFIQPERQKSFPTFAASSPQLSAALGFSPNMNSGSPFVNSPHGHPGFTPSKLGGRNSIQNDGRNQKQPKPPEKPLMPYMRYSRKVWEQVRVGNADLKVYEIGKLIGQMWRDLPADQKQEYADQFELEKMEYNQLLRAFHDSPAYQSWLKSAKQTEHEKAKRLTGFQSPQKMPDGKVTLQTVDDDEDVDEFSQKHVASARYLRNHRLVNEIFSDSVVPDVRSVVMTNRMQVLRRQVQSLTNHQNKLEAELSQIEDKFEAKKRRFLEASETFQNEMKERCESKVIDAQKYQKMIDKAVDEITADVEKSRQVREEQARIQQLEDAKREAEAAANTAPVLPVSTDVPHEQPEVSISANVTADAPAAPSSQFVASHPNTTEAAPVPTQSQDSHVPRFPDHPNLPDITGTDSLTNDSSATSCSQSQESLPADPTAAHDPAMDEDTDAEEDTLDELLDEQSSEAMITEQIVPEQQQQQHPAQVDTSLGEPMETSAASDVIPDAQKVVPVEEVKAVVVAPQPEADVQTLVPPVEVIVHPLPVPQREQEPIPEPVMTQEAPAYEVPQVSQQQMPAAADFPAEQLLPVPEPQVTPTESAVDDGNSNVPLDEIPLPPVPPPDEPVVGQSGDAVVPDAVPQVVTEQALVHPTEPLVTPLEAQVVGEDVKIDHNPEIPSSDPVAAAAPTTASNAPEEANLPVAASDDAIPAEQAKCSE